MPYGDGSDIALKPAKFLGTFAEFEAAYRAGEVDGNGNPLVDEPTLTDEQVAQVLRGDYSPLGLAAAVTAAAPPGGYTTGMIALLPTIADQERLAVEGGEDEEELHLTLCFLGEVAKIPPSAREQIVSSAAYIARERLPIVDADGFAIGRFNADDVEKETCVVLLCSGDELARAHREVYDAIGFGDYLPEQHSPWIPHVTLAYDDNKSLVGKLQKLEGPIRFDTLRVAFGDQVTDFPLYDGTAKVATPPEYAAMSAAGTKESDVNAKGGGHNLKNYWVHGEGAAKIGWGTDGSFARCVSHLGKYVKSPQGLCAEYHHAATGEWPTEGGKHGIPSAVDITTFEEGVVADAAVDLEAELGDYDGGWEGPIMAEDSDTGDGRMFAGGSVTWGDTAETIHPLQWAASNLGEHKGSVTVGRIDKIWRDPQNPRTIMGKGRFNVNDPDGLRAFRQTRDGFAGGISVDPDQISDADVELEFAVDADPTDMMAKPTKTIFHAGRLRGATLVAFPALVEAAIKLTKKSDAPALVAASKAPWRAVEHEVRLGDDMIDGLVASVAFAYVQNLDDMVTRQQCRFLHHEIDENGEPGLASLIACARHIKAINDGRTFGLSVKELRSAYDHMAQHFADAGEVAPAFTLAAPDAVVAAVPMAAPLEWFGKPELAGPTPVTVTEDGRVFGHAATWGTCHTGFADTCVTPPLENDYSYFTTGEVLTAEGHRVAVGQITLGTSHAATRGLSVARAIDHYGDTGTAVADVTAGVDDHGIWIAGAVRPGSSDEHVHALRASALSGDWRRIGGQLRMVALLAVNVPGFPIPRVGTALAAGKQVSLVAAGVVDRANITLEDELASLDLACGISAAMKKPRKKYASMAAELADLDADVKE